MASPSNDALGTNKVKNMYFFYGTHPVKVPNHIVHSNSATQLISTTDPHRHNLSLNLINTYNNNESPSSSIPTTQSLRDFSQSPREEEEMSEIYEDALESFDDDRHKNRRRSSAKHEMPPLDLPEIFKECEQITKLFFENHLNEALTKTKALENQSFYHALCHSTTTFMHATMTFDPADIETAIQALRHTSSMAKKYEPYRPWIPFNFSAKPVMTEHELHAKLVYAEALLIRALLTFIQDQSLFSFISGALKIKECHDLYLKLAKQNDPSKFSSRSSYEHFDSGVRLGNGAFNLMISNLPQRIIKYLEFAGFSGNREFGLRELEKSANSNGLRAVFSALLLLSYHTFVLQVLGNCDGDLEICHMLVERNLQVYSNSYLFLFFRARLQAIHCRLDEGIKTYQFAIECQTDWKDLHHLAFWEILWCHVLRREWKEASVMAERLLDENNWSKATYCYMLSTFIFEDNNCVANDEVIKLYKRVPELKIRLAGKSIPLEKYAMKKCDHFLAQGWLFQPALELLYLMNGFYILSHDTAKLNETYDRTSKAFDDLIRNRQNDRYYIDSYGSGLLLCGVLLSFLHRYDEAHENFDEIVRLAKRFDKKSFLAPTALLEKGLIYVSLKQKQRATDCLHRSLNDYKDYHLESRVQFRINSAMQTVKQMDNANQ